MKRILFAISTLATISILLSCQKEPEVVKVESVTLNSTSITMVEGELKSLTATVSPSNADNKKIIWSSSDTSVATIDDRGIVTAVAPGMATITAKSDDGGKTATCSVTVKAKVYPVESVSLDKTCVEITEGETLTLTATVKPDNATNKNVLWSSSNGEIATVEDGVVTAIKEGEATITAKSDDGGKTATCSVTVKAKVYPVESISLDKTKLALEVGTTAILTATVSPADATDKTITWSSSNNSIATVKDGVVTAIKVGTASISAKAGEKTATCAVTVKEVVTKNPFTITSVGTTSVSIEKVNYPRNITLEYRKGEGSWSTYKIGSTISLADGENVQFISGEEGNDTFSMGEYNYTSHYYNIVVSGSGSVKASGSIISLLDRTGKRTTMPQNGFFNLFFDCIRLVDASKLELTTLANSCYSGMFKSCTSLTQAPKLPATTLADHCYSDMFKSCTSLTQAPELPATTLADHCYSGMFSSCTSLTQAPELPATTLANSCYSGMFKSCTSLTQAPELPATTLAKYCYSGMFEMCESLQKVPRLPATTLADHCCYQMFHYCESLQTAPELPATTLAEYCYYRMFENCTSLTRAPELPATTLANDCYSNMFSKCRSLKTAPELPATTLASGCYSYMFDRCESLQTAPNRLPATTLASSCYSFMFFECSKLQTAPELPATTLASSCYYEMFYGCSKLRTAPELPATTLASSCYSGMFYGCSMINYVKALFVTSPTASYTKSWLYNVSSTGTFVKSKDATWDVTGPNGIPEGWTVRTE